MLPGPARRSSPSQGCGGAASTHPADAAFLAHCGLDRATALIVTASSRRAIDEAVRAARAARADLVIVARAKDAEHASQLYALGATDAVPETLEASLQLSEAALIGLGVPAGRVIASVHDERDALRAELQRAAGRPTRAVQAPRRTAGP